MNPFWYFLIWYAIGAATLILTTYLDYRDGADLTLKEIGKGIILSTLGPVLVLVGIIDPNMIVIRGKKK